MKKISLILAVSAAVLLVAGCKAQAGSGEEEVDSKEPIVIIEREKIDESLPNGTPVTTSDGYLTVIPTKDGLLIKKNHPSTWEHNTIHVIQVGNGQENTRIDNIDQYTNTVLYPFVKKGMKYRVHIEKQEANWTNWGESDKVEVEAIGGSGNYYIKFDSYRYYPNSKAIEFNKLTFCHPELKGVDGYYEGPVFNGTVWGTGVKNSYEVSYELKKSTLYITDRTNFLDNQDKIGIALSYKFSMPNSAAGKDIVFSCPVISSVIYNAIFSEDKQLNLKGGVKIPRVDISSAYGDSKGSSSYNFGDNWVEATMTITDTNGSVVLNSAACKLKDRGNSTKWTGKVPWSVKLDEKASVLGMPKHKRWVLMANYFDRSLIRTQFASFMGNKVFNSYWNASFTPVNVYINGKFMGTYDLGECNKINKNRVNVQSIEDYATKDSGYVDVNGDGNIDIEDAGFMVEIDTAINGGNGGIQTINKSNYKTKVGTDYNAAERIYFYSSEKCIPMTLKDPDFGDWALYDEDTCLEVGTYAKSKIDAFEKMLYSDDFKTKYTDYIDTLSFIDWYLVNEFGKNSDANFQKSVPVTYNPATGLLYMGPNWDFDLSLGNFNHGYDSDFGNSTVDDPTGWYIYGGRKGCDENALYCEVNNTTQVQTWWINRLMESSDFKSAVKARWNEKKSTLKSGIETKILEYGNRVYDYIPANEANLPRLGVYEWNGPSGYENRKTYKQEVSYLYNWSIARYNWMDKEINKW